MAAAWWYERADYDEKKKCYRVWHEDGQMVEYYFTMERFDDEDDDIPEGQITLALSKSWEEDEYGFIEELYPFAALDHEDQFEQVVDEILAEGREASLEENLDEFLAVMDVVKHRAIDADFDDEGILELEGLFTMGPPDAYTQREYDYDCERLHHHVERPDDECWRIGVAKVKSTCDPAQVLGWACYVIHYPDLTSSASDADIEQAQTALLLDLDHHVDEVAAHLAAEQLRKHMAEGDRVENPEYAYLNDTLVFEFMSVLGREENDYCPEWQVLSGETLQSFRQSACLDRQEQWYPRDFFRDFAEDSGFSQARVDQFATMLREEFGLKPLPFEEDSPFNDLEL